MSKYLKFDPHLHSLDSLHPIRPLSYNLYVAGGVDSLEDMVKAEVDKKGNG